MSESAMAAGSLLIGLPDDGQRQRLRETVLAGPGGSVEAGEGGGVLGLRAGMDVIAADTRPDALHVMSNNMKILQLVSEAITLALDSTRVLDRSFGPSQAAQGGPPRIGKQDAA